KVDRAASLAARFAAKEATLKALGTGWDKGLGLNQVEVERDEEGPPRIKLHGAALEKANAMKVTSIWLTLAHDAGVAVATVVLEG
ncbi:MAG: holo-ACP synthase, partial [Planctomycetes bacterium]|nr:holo-ACP synthase [Planctomycetota bacterium]